MYIPKALTLTATAALIATFMLAEPASAHPQLQSAAVGAYTLTAARLWATSAALLGLAGVIVGVRALRRAGNGSVVALATGLIATVVGALNLAVADGGPGTGNGVVGGALAVLLGLLAMELGRRARAQARRTT
ncbi:DUF6223 family protein [Streptomyces sp. NPDC046821]|uniref:DUF6223 family protein n=1 Tax=Streptomyces sp. NPDC046821 TaxID=3154702 RepID=UPI0033F7E4FE